MARHPSPHASRGAAGAMVPPCARHTEDRGAGPPRGPQPRREAQRASTTSWCSALGAAPSRAAADDDAVQCVVRARRGPDVLLGHGRRLPRRRWPASPERLRAFRRPILETWNLLEEMPKPTIAPDPRRLHRRGDGARARLRPARDGRRRRHRPGRDAGRPDPRRRRLVAAARRRRPRPRQGDDHGLEAGRRHARPSGSAWSTASAPAEELDAATERLVGELLACAPRAVAYAKRAAGRDRQAEPRRRRSSTRSPPRSCARARGTSPRARARSSRSVSRSSAAADAPSPGVTVATSTGRR